MKRHIMVCELGSYEMLNAIRMLGFDYHTSMDRDTWRAKQAANRRMDDALNMVVAPIYAVYRVLEVEG